MKSTHLLIVLLLLALTGACIMLVCPRTSGQDQQPADTAAVVLDNIMTRTSVRAFTDQTVEDTKIEQLLRAGMAAPTAVNRQPWHFVVVTQREQLDALSMANPNASMLRQAPLAIIVCGDMTKALDGVAREYWVQDASAATENILLAAHAQGLGAVWTGAYPGQERCEAISRQLNLPEHIVPLNMIVIGYPAQHPQPKQKFTTDNISYNTFGGQEGAVVQVNPFKMLSGSGMLLSAGNREQSNAMTIGWGGFGKLWRNNMLTVYVAEARYTKQMLDRSDYFCVMHFDDSYDDMLLYMGRNSGRDGDKAAACGLHTAYTENVTPYYTEADMVIECRLMYVAPFDTEGMREIPSEFYRNFDAGMHYQYVGQIVSAMKK